MHGVVGVIIWASSCLTLWWSKTTRKGIGLLVGFFTTIIWANTDLRLSFLKTYKLCFFFYNGNFS